MRFKLLLGLTSAIITGAALQLRAETRAGSVCELLDPLIIPSETKAVRGDVQGTFYHGFFLVPEGGQETCNSGRQVGFIRRALLAIDFPSEAGTITVPDEFSKFAQMRHVRITATLYGRVLPNRFTFTFRNRKGNWFGFGGDWPNDTVPAKLLVQSVRDWVTTPDSRE
jgi:hypothetical protein